MPTPGGVGRWTRYFAVASAASMVALQAIQALGGARRTIAVVGLFGAVFPMVFGMAYLLLPAYVGRTLSTRWLPGIHLLLASAGAGLLAVDTVGAGNMPAFALGSVAWSLGVAVFVVTLGKTVLPPVLRDPTVVVRSPDRPQRSTRLATATLPVAFGYLLVGTVALLSTAGLLPDVVGATLPQTVHYYGAGFVALMIFTLGARLLVGFFHVEPPRYLTWGLLVAGAVGPSLLGAAFWRPPWFYVGAGLELLALAAYAGVVGTVASRTDRQRVGRYGIAFGSVAGLAGGGVALLAGTGVVPSSWIVAHVTAMLDGFLLVTIVGYGYQFFPVTNRQFPGATEQTALASIALLAGGVTLSVVGSVTTVPWLHLTGSVLELLGTGVYAYLLGRRLLWER